MKSILLPSTQRAQSIPSSVLKAQSIVGVSPGRPKSDFYPTPEPVTRALLSAETFQGSIWECACGDGAMSKVLESAGYNVYSSDLYCYGYGDWCDGDFLLNADLIYPNIVTNPPFSLADLFVYHAMIELQCDKLALLCKLAFLEGQKRSRLLELTHLTRVHVFRKRIQLTRNGEKPRGGGMIAFAWFVWERGYAGAPQIDWI